MKAVGHLGISASISQVTSSAEMQLLTPYLFYQSLQHRIEHLKVLLRPRRESSVEELDLFVSFFDTGLSVRDGLSVFVEALEGIKQPGLKRLGITGFYDVNSRKEVSQTWVCQSAPVSSSCSVQW